MKETKINIGLILDDTFEVYAVIRIGNGHVSSALSSFTISILTKLLAVPKILYFGYVLYAYIALVRGMKNE